MPITQANRILELGTPLGTDALLIESMHFSEELGRPFHLELKCVAPQVVAAADILGLNVSVRLNLDETGNTERYFNGYVTKFALVDWDGLQPMYNVTVMSFLWLMGRTSDCRTFCADTPTDAITVVQDLIKEKGFSDVDYKVTGSFPQRSFIVQYRETAFNFVSRLMEEEGVYYFFEQADGKHTMVFANDPSAHSSIGTKNFEVTTNKGGGNPDTIVDWIVDYEVKSGGFAMRDYNLTTPTTMMDSVTQMPGSYAQASNELYDYPGGYETASDGSDLSRTRLEEAQVHYEVASGLTYARDFTAGATFILAEHPDSNQNKEWLITSVAIEAQNPWYGNDEEDAREGSYQCRFTAIPALTTYRPARSTPEPVIFGPQPALVVGAAGDEICTDQYGRIKVSFMWDRYNSKDDKSSFWMRVSQSWAGAKWGGVFIPRVGMEVVVEFVNGDPDYPIVTGCVYNATNMPPYTLPDNKTMSTIKSNSSLGGSGFNEFRFEDKAGSEQIFIHGQKDQDIRILNDCREWIGHDRNLHVINNHIEEIGLDHQETIDRDHVVKITRDHHEAIGGKEAKAVTGTRSLKVTDDLIEQFGANHSEVTTKDHYLKADNIIIEGMTSITIKVGQSFIAIDATGISIGTNGAIDVKAQQTIAMQSTLGFSAQGLTFDAKANTQMSLQGTVMVAVKGPMVQVSGDAMLTLKGGIVMIN